MTKLLRNVENGHDHMLNQKFNFGSDDHHTEWMLANAKFQSMLPSYRSDLPELFNGRLHNLMHYTSSTVEDSLY